MPKKSLPENEKKISISTTVSRESYENAQGFKTLADYLQFLLDHINDEGKKKLAKKIEQYVLS